MLPWWLQPISLALPAAHVSEGMPAALLDGTIAWGHLAAALRWRGLVALRSWIFLRTCQSARVRGALLNIGE